MISIIICSIGYRQFSTIEQSIATTIGVPYEIIRIDNSSNDYSLCAAYNKGVNEANYPLLCFMHEDVIIHTSGWGQTVHKIFSQHPQIGLLGVAGSTYKSYAPWGWGLIKETRVVNLIQKYKYDNLPSFHDQENQQLGSLSQVACIDGVWMCTRKDIAAEITFDDKTFNGFHCYDIDFCLSVRRKYKLAVTFDVLLTHLSEGRNDRSWVIETLKLHRKWKHELPVVIERNDSIDYAAHENKAVTEFLYLMMELEFSTWNMLKMLYYNRRNKQMNKRLLFKLQVRVLKDWLKEQYTKVMLFKH